MTRALAFALAAALAIACSTEAPAPAPQSDAVSDAPAEFIEAGPIDSVVEIGGTRVGVEERHTGPEQALGLGKRRSLAWDRGMLFVYPGKRAARFWMKNMHFAIDIVWIAEGRIVQIDARVPPPAGPVPDRELPVYPARMAVDRVLEVPAGYAAAHGWAVGDPVRFEAKSSAAGAAGGA